MRTSSRRRRCESGKRLFRFQGRRPSFAPVRLDARAPNQFNGLALADQGHPRAALDANDLWIRGVGAQHPVESYGQSSRRRYLGNAFRLAVAAVGQYCLRNPSSSRTTLCAASTSSMRRKRLPCLLMAPSRCRPPSCARAGSAPDSWPPVCQRKAGDVADGSARKPRRDRAHSRLAQQQIVPADLARPACCGLDQGAICRSK